MTNVRALESPLAAWRSFRDIARATQTLAAAQALQWSERSRRADEHLAWCEAVAAEYPLVLDSQRPRVVLAVGSDLGLCGPLNRLLAERCAAEQLDAAPTILRIVVGARLATLEPFADAVELSAPSTLPAARKLATDIEGLIEQLPDPLQLDLTIVLAGAVEGDGQPRVEVRTSETPDLELQPAQQLWLDKTTQALAVDPPLAMQAHQLARHARLVAALARAITSENEARWRTMGRAFESAQRKIAEQEQRLRKLRQELITQEMLEARQGARGASL
ncbi:MAG: F0F1 ATP synthase subunit gamma [Enhygromyxa sp.]